MTDRHIGIYEAWDLNIRLFHWVNVLCVIVLSVLGLVILNRDAIGITSVEAVIGLKALHSTIGYVFTTNLIIRVFWGFLGDRHSRWSSLIPGRDFKLQLDDYKASLASGKPQTFIGHNPRGRISVLLMMTLLLTMMTSGLIRAGTDIYYPPFGDFIALYVAAEGVAPSEIKPYDETGTDSSKMAKIENFKKPFGTIHLYGAYVLWLMILIHITAVIRADAGGQGTLISSMFTGKKHLPREPEDR